MSAHPASGVYALLADGSTVEIRPAAAGDFGAVQDMHRAMSPDNIYLRFFSVSPAAAGREARRICREPGPDHAALLAWLAGELVGVASYETSGAADRAEIAFAVADHAHHRGVATLLLEHLVSAGRSRGVRTFIADVLAENSAMLKVFAAAGLQARRTMVDGVTELAFDLPGDGADPAWEAYLDAVAAREGRADVASLRHVLAAESVAVVGASRRPESVGRAILRNILSGGYGGRVYVVHPHASELDGIRCLRSAAALPEPVDLVVVSVPAPAVLDVAEECGRRGAGALVVITSGLDPAGRAALLALLPPPRHAAGRPGRPRRCGAWHRPERDLRREASRGGPGGPGGAVRRDWHRPARAADPARHRHLLVRLAGRQGRRVRQ